MGRLDVSYYEFLGNYKNGHDAFPDIIFDCEWNKKINLLLKKDLCLL